MSSYTIQIIDQESEEVVATYDLRDIRTWNDLKNKIHLSLAEDMLYLKSLLGEPVAS